MQPDKMDFLYLQLLYKKEFVALFDQMRIYTNLRFEKFLSQLQIFFHLIQRKLFLSFVQWQIVEYLLLLDKVCYYILVKKQNTAENGEIVVALIGDEATVKTFYKEKDHIRLQPENSTMDPIIVPDCQILGKVGGVFRKI